MATNEYNAKVTGVIDGDTAIMDVEFFLFGRKCTAHDVKIRFLGINTPERGQEGYVRAKVYTANRILNKQVKLYSERSVHEIDDFNRLLATIYLDGVNINSEILSKGLAKVYEK